MRKILAIAWKDTVIRFSSRSELFFFLLLPILFTLILGGATFDQEDPRIVVQVVNLDEGGALAAELLTVLEASTAVVPNVVPPDTAVEPNNNQPAWLIIPPHFSRDLLAGQPATLGWEISTANSNWLVAEQAVRQAMGEINQTMLIAETSTAVADDLAPFADETARAAYYAQSRTAGELYLAERPNRLTITRPAVGDEAENGWQFSQTAQAAAGQLITWVFIPLLGTSGLFAYERLVGTFRRLLTTPTSKQTVLIGTISGQLAAALVQMAVLVGFGWLVMGVSWGRSAGGLALLLFMFALSGVALGTMLGTWVKTTSQASGISIMLGMLFALLGGAWYPMELFPPLVQTVVKVLPTTWAMQGMTNLMMRGQGLEGVLLESAVLLGFTVLFFGVGVRRLRFE